MNSIALMAINKKSELGGFKFVATLLLFILLVTHPLLNFSQTRSVNIVFSDFGKTQKCKIFKIDSISINNSLNKCLIELHNKGYLAARIDSVRFVSTDLRAWATLGTRYNWDVSSPNSTLNFWLKNSGQPYKRFKTKPVNSFDIAEVSEKLVLTLENNGYPFAKVATKVQQVDSSLLAINFTLQQGPYIYWDTIVVKGDARISHRFINRYVDFPKSKAYSEVFLNQINSKIAELPYLSSIRKAEVEFLSKTANLYLYITNRKANRFSGVIGVSSDKSSSSGIKFTGDLNLTLWNSFRNGEYILVKWAGLGEGTQNLNTIVRVPFIAASSIGFEVGFNMHKQDSSFLNINPRGAFTFKSFGGLITSLGVELKKSNTLITQNSATTRNYSTVLYSLSFQNGEGFANEFPQPGFFYNSSFAAGRQNYIQSGTTKRRSLSNAHAQFSYTFPLVTEFLLVRIASTGQAMFELSKSAETVEFTENELYRLGGAENLRGFNQESILTDKFVIGTVELHLVAKQAASIFIFTDMARISQLTNSINTISWASGVGVGTLLNTRNGILNFNLAMGNGFGQKFSFRDSKVHIGYIAGF